MNELKIENSDNDIIKYMVIDMKIFYLSMVKNQTGLDDMMLDTNGTSGSRCILFFSWYLLEIIVFYNKKNENITDSSENN